MPVVRRVSRATALLVVLLVVAALAAACSDDRAELAGIVRDPALDVGAVVLPEVDAAGATSDLTFRAEPGELLVVFFGYTHCPDVCPTTMADLRTALGRLGRDAERIAMAFVTTDPERDTPAALHVFLDAFVEGAHAVRTTDAAQLHDAEQAFVAQSEVIEHAHGETEVEHSAAVYVVDAAGTVLVEWPVGTPNTAISDDLKLLLDTTGTAMADDDA